MALAYSDFNQTPLIQHTYPPHHVVCIGMLDSQQSGRTSNWRAGPVVPAKNSWLQMVGFREEWRCASCHSAASTFLYCQDPSFSLFGHIARMNESTDASCILFEPPSEVWRKPRGRPHNSWVRTVPNDLANSYTGLPEAREAAQDRVYWRMLRSIAQRTRSGACSIAHIGLDK